MKIIFAKNLGFCYGAKRAINIAHIALKEDKKPVQFLGSLVHNEEVMERLKKEGGKIVSDLTKVKSGTLIIKAHGIDPALEEKIPKSVLLKDATCPLVKKAQLKAEDFFQKGYQVIIIGNKNHPETKGIKGYAKNRAIIIENEFQAKNPLFLKKLRGKKVGVVLQTTQNMDNVLQILKILKREVKNLQLENTICPETLSRQKELSKILKRADGILLIGSFSSSNTNRLAEIVKKSRKKLWRVNSLKELKKINFKNINSLGVISGTSSPDWEIEKIKKYLAEKISKDH